MKNNNYASFFKAKPKKVERYIRCRKCGGNMEWVEYYPPEIKCPKCGYTVYPKPYEPNCNEIENCNATYEAVEWGVAGWVAHEANSIDRQYIDEFDLEHYEVVGNIFDNKELLQEGYK